MKRFFIANAVLVAALSSRLMAADPVDGKVIHHYNFAEGGYGYLHDVGDSINAHGVHAQLSFEEHNVVVTVGGGHFWGDEALNFWNLNTSVGYVLRLADNHLNVIPRFGAVYSDASTEGDTGTLFGNETWSIAPGATVSYALNNRLALAGTYAYAYNLDAEEGDHVFSVGPRIAIFERVGVNVNALLSDEDGFLGVTAAVEFHF